MLFVSARCFLILFRRQAFDKALDHSEIIISTPVLLELAEVLARNKLNKYLTEQSGCGFWWPSSRNPSWSGSRNKLATARDPKDNSFSNWLLWRCRRACLLEMTICSC